MADAGHIELVRDRLERWNDWRRKNTRIIPDLSGADLSEIDLAGANLARADLTAARLSGTNLSGANLSRARLFRADLSQADLSRANLFKTNLCQADLGGANLNRADLTSALLIRANLSGASLLDACLNDANLGQASLFRSRLDKAVLRRTSFFKSDLTGADFTGADLAGANFQEAVLEETSLVRANAAGANLCFATLLRANLEGAVLDNCAVYGASLWEVRTEGASQRDLDIMPAQQPVLSVDSLQTAQLVGMLLHHRQARDEVFAVTLNTALVIGRFPGERKAVLAAVKEAPPEGRLLAPGPGLRLARFGRQERDRQDPGRHVPVHRRRPERRPAHRRDPGRGRPFPAVHPHPADRPGGRGAGRGPALSQVPLGPALLALPRSVRPGRPVRAGRPGPGRAEGGRDPPEDELRRLGPSLTFRLVIDSGRKE
ncbi:MAG: pentapeptide repeat-containing protein [Acidobacteriota bacterium]